MTEKDIKKQIEQRHCPSIKGFHSYVSLCSRKTGCLQCWKRAVEGGKKK